MAPAVRFDKVTKDYLRGGPSQHSLRDEAAQALRRVLVPWRRGHAGSPLTGRRALHQVSFDIEPGESVGLIGPNGSGKTTALKLLARITYPSSGRIVVRGSLGGLIEVGSSIHPELTGRENIWLAGQILGMAKTDVRRRFDEIVDFAELGHVLDTQAKLYSSGMQLRLGFSIAAHVEPNVLVIDEALAVGDAGFQARCVERMGSLVEAGTTLIFVSHDLPAVEAVCNRGIFLLDGELQVDDSTPVAIRSYLDWVDSAHQARLADATAPAPSRYLDLERVECADRDGRDRYVFQTGDDLVVRLRFRATEPIGEPHVNVGISDGRKGMLVLCTLAPSDQGRGDGAGTLDGWFTLQCTLHDLPLLPRVYQLWCSVQAQRGHADLFDWQAVGSFRMEESQEQRRDSRAVTASDGPVFVSHQWGVTRG